MKTSIPTVGVCAFVAFFGATLLNAQLPGTPATSTNTAPAPDPAPPPRPVPLSPSPATVTSPEFYDPISFEIFYWISTTHPALRTGKAATDIEDLDYPGKGKKTPGIDLRVPLTGTAMLDISGFVTKGSSNTVAGQDLDLFGTSYTTGDVITDNYSVKNFKVSFQDLFYPFPAKDGQRWRVNTLWEVQYAGISTNITAPITDSSGNTTANTATGSRFVVYPTFGLRGEYHVSPNLTLRGSASGFAIPHHSAIGDGDASLNYRFKSVELVIADKFFYFKTSPKNAEYFKTTLWGPYIALRVYPSDISLPCMWCGKGNAVKNDSGKTTDADEANEAASLSVATKGAGSSDQSTSNSTAKGDRGTYIPRVSGGLSLSVLGLSLIPNKSSTVTNTSTVSTAYDTKGASQRIGYGATLQLALTNHFAFDVGGYLRRIGYQFDTTVSTTTSSFVGSVLTPITTTTSTHEDTRARLIDIPALLRYYNLGRHTPGSRWFVEGGAALREARSIRTSLSSTDSGGTVTCCTNTPVSPAHSNARGLIGGAGAEFIDPLGIHVVPEVRYTRWTNQIFESVTTSTQRNEVTAGVSLTF